MTTRGPSIGEILRDARLGDLRTLAEERESYDLFASSRRLFALLRDREIKYVLVGGMAMLQYVDGRNTRDIDLVMAREDLERLPELEVVENGRDFARAHFEGVQVDLLLAANPVFQFVRERHTNLLPFVEGEVPTATPEGLALLKLFALPSLYRQGDFTRSDLYEGDITALVRLGVFDEERVLGVLEKYMLSTDIAALRSLLADIHARIRSASERGGGTI